MAVQQAAARFEFAPTSALRPRTVRLWAGVSALLLCSLVHLGIAGRAASAELAPARPPILQVRQLDDGEWIGLVIARGRRARVDIPQSREEIESFAEQHGVIIKWIDDEPSEADDLDESTTPVGTSPQAPKAGETAPPPAVVAEAGNAAPVSAAEQATRLERTIVADTQRLEVFRAELANPEGEYQQAESEFKAAEAELAKKQAEIAALREAGKPEELNAATEALETLRGKHELCKQRFDLAIQTRKTVQEQIAALEEKLKQDRVARDKLTGAVPAVTTDAEPPADSSTQPIQTATASAEPAAPPAVVAVPAAATAVETAEAPPGEQASSETKAGAQPVEEPVSAEVQEAQQQAEQKREEARVAELEVQSVTERIQTLDKTISLEQKLFDAARKKADIAYQQQHTLQADYQKKLDAGATSTELRALAQEQKNADKLFESARTEVAERTDRLRELQTERSALQAEELVALRTAEEKQGEAASAEEHLVTLKNPFSMQNMLQWLLDHGVKVALILFGMLLSRSFLMLGTRRLANFMVRSGARGTREQREDRANTLAGVFENAGSLAIVVGGILMVCDEVGIAVGPLMGGAAVVGLAVAFGAQNLIRDYFYGFVILLENQYKINDILKIGDTSGQVERISLRMTVLRDLEGRVHFIPNGKIDSVTNMTHGWSRAVFDIGVAYKEDADAVMDVLMELAHGLRDDPAMGPMILDEPEMLGVDAFGDSAVVIKFMVKTRPLKQWAVKRELLRRIKRRFDELGIEIPFPHRTLYHHSAQQSSDEVRDEYDSRRAA